MATDATGTPTSLGLPKYDTSVDAPSGLGFNAAMDSINTILVAMQADIAAAGVADGSITTAKLADGAVTTAKITDSQVTSAKIANGTIVDGDVSASASIALTKLADPVAKVTAAGVRIEQGSAVTDASGNATITFGTAFAATPAVVAAVLHSDNRSAVHLTAASTTGATIHAEAIGAGAISDTVYWIAIGS